MYKLILAEKPSAARSIAAVLNANERGGGFLMGCGYIVSWCAGHLLELAEPGAYGDKFIKWRYADLPLIPDKWFHIPSKGKDTQLQVVADLMNRTDVDCIINACDAGREGELIFRLVYEYARCKKPTKRLWVSSMEDAAIKAGIENLKDGCEYDSLYASASCRERADWCVGYSATRLFSILYGATLNVGRVQSPTLAMLVKREAEIASFVKEPFYVPVIECGGFAASGDRIGDKEAAEQIRDDCNGKDAVVISVERANKTVSPPKLYDLTTLQREANRLLGFTAQQTLDYIQSLYEKKLLSYPRTDCRYLTGDMRETASKLIANLMPSKAFDPNIDRLIDDTKITDHHAIVPTAEIIKADLSGLPSGERDIMRLVTMRLLSASAPAYSYEAVTAVLDCGGHRFEAKGKTIIEDGWKSIEAEYLAALKNKPEAEDAVEDDGSLPAFDNGEVFPNAKASVREGSTTPPKRLTEDTMLSGMENAGAEDMPDDAERKGLGTPATRAAVIEKLIKAGLVERQKKNLVPTDKGRNLIAVLPEALTSAKLTADWEHKLKQVECGELACDAFMESIAVFIREIVSANSAPKPEYVVLFSEKKSDAPVLGDCPRCGSPIREDEKGYFCDSHSCGFKLWKDSRFWTAKRMPLTSDIVAALLRSGRVMAKGLYSEKTGRKYDAVVVLDDTGDKFINYRLEFGEGAIAK